MKMEKWDKEANKELNEMGDIKDVEAMSSFNKLQERTEERMLKIDEIRKCQNALVVIDSLVKQGILDPKMTAGELPCFLEDRVNDLRKDLEK